MSLARCQIIPIDVNFHIPKSFEIFDKNSADKIWFKKDKEIKVSPLMPIRVKHNGAKRKRLSEVALDILLATQRFNEIFSDLSQNILWNK